MNWIRWRAPGLPRLALLVALVMTLFITVAAIGQAGPPTISTDQQDYPPGATAQITGSGFQAGETVRLQVIHYDQTASEGDAYEPWTATADDNGGFQTSWYVDAYSVFLLTADGLTSGLHAEWVFTDDGQKSTTTAVTCAPNPSVTGQSVTITAMVTTSNGNGTANPTGTVEFYDGAAPSGVKVGSAPVDQVSGSVSISTSSLSKGTHTIYAYYSGDRNNPGSSGSTTQTVNAAIVKTTPTITWSNPAAITYGTALGSTQLNATASAPGGFVYTPAAGTVLNAGTGQNLHVDFTPTDSSKFNSASADVKIDVNKASQTIAFGSLASKTYGDTPFTVSASASSTLPVSFSIVSGPASLSSNTVTITGVGTVKVRASQAGNSNYLAAADVDQSFTVAPAAATVTLDAATLSQTYDGSPKTVTASTTPAGLAVQVTYAQSGQAITSPTNAGSYDVNAVITDPNYAGSAKGTLTIAKAASTVTWSNPADITYGTALGSTQLNATASAPGSFVYTPAAGTVLNAGTGQNLHVDFTPTDAVNYAGSSADVKINVKQAGQSITFNSLANKTYGDASFTVSASASSGLPVSFSIVSGPATINGTTVTITGAGMVKVRASQAGDGNYLAAADVDQSFTVAKAGATVTLDAATLSQTYDGSPKTVTASTTPAGLAVQVTYAQSGQAITSPTNAGSYDVNAVITDPNYAGSAKGTLTIAKAASTVTWSNPAAITYGTALGSTQLNATANVAGSFTYTPASGTKLMAGNGQKLKVDFTPTDAANYTGASAEVTIDVNKAVATVSLSDLAATYDGTARYASATTNPANLNVAISYKDSAQHTVAAPTDAGTYDVTATIMDPNYTGSAMDKLVISPAKLTLKAADQTKVYLAAMPALTGSLTGVVNGDGITASYSTTATTNSPVGNYDIVPSLNDPNNRLSNYTVEATNGTLKITKATATVTLANLSQVYDGNKKAVTVTTVPSGLAVVVVYSQNNQAVDPINAGSYHVVATVNDANYQGSATDTLTITQATPVITWSNPAAITYGTALSNAQLNASANVTGSYVYTPASGTRLKAGTGQKLHVDFTPADNANYTGASAEVTIDVNKANTSVGVTSSLNPSVYGSSVLFTATVTSVLGDATGSVDFYDGDTSGTKIGSGTVNATSGKATASTSTLAAGAHTITAVYVGDANNLGSQNGDLTQQVQKATPVITWNAPAAITYGTALGNAQLNATASVAGNLVYSPIAGTVLSAGASQNLHVDFTPTDQANYNSASADVKIDVNPAPLSVEATSYARPYGTANPTLDGTLTGVVNGDGITASYSTTAATNSPVGDYPIVPSLNDPNFRLGNYTVTKTNGTLTVTRRSTSIAFATNQSWTGVYAHPSAFSATVTDTVSSTPAANVTVKFIVGTQSITAITDVNGVARATLILTQAPGSYTLTATAAQTATLTDSSVQHAYVIQQDLSTSMFVSNTGTNLIWTSSTNTSTATVALNCQLSAWDLGLNKPADPNSYTGDIRYAKVTFGWRNADGSVTPIPSAQNLPVGLVNSGDPTVGTASAIAQVDIGTAQEKGYTIAMVISGYYVDGDPAKGNQAHDFSLTVARPGQGNEILGVGAVANSDTQGDSNGILQGDRDQNTSFQFDVLYNKSMTNLQGGAKVWITSHNAYDSARGQWFIDSVAHCYLVKSNSLAGLQISSPQAQVAAKCTVQDVSPWLSQPVSVDGGAQLTISLKGNQTPVTANQVAITVQNSKGGLWFSSCWGANGTLARNLAAVKQPNGSTCVGNVVVK